MRAPFLRIAAILIAAVSCSGTDSDATTDPGTQGGGPVDGSVLVDGGGLGPDGAGASDATASDGSSDAASDAVVEAGACAAQGQLLDLETYEVVGGAGHAVAVPGGLVMAGNYTTLGISTPAFGSMAAPATASSEAYVLKRADDGTEPWLALPRGNGQETALGLASDAAGDVYALVTGTSGTTTLTADPLTQDALGTLSPGDQPAYVVKLAAATGQAQWISSIVGAQCGNISVGPNTVAVQCRIGSGTLAFRTGASTTSSLTAFGDDNITVLGLDPATGYVQWHSQLGVVRAAGLAADVFGGVAVAANGDVVIAGSFREGSLQDTLVTPSHKVDPLDASRAGFVGIVNHTNGQISALTAFGTDMAVTPRFASQGALLLFGRYGTLTLGGVLAPGSSSSFLAVVPNTATLTPTLIATGPMDSMHDAVDDSCGRFTVLGRTLQTTWQGRSIVGGTTVLKLASNGAPSWVSGVASSPNDGTALPVVVTGGSGRTAVVGRVEGQKSIVGGPTFGQNDGVFRPFVAIYGP